MLVAWVILGTYCFLAFLPMPGGIGTGLDASWQYTLSRAAHDKLIFGRDIIFTYGPLGYLVAGSAWSQNFFEILVFRFVVHLVLFGVAFAKIVNFKTNREKITLVLSLLLAYLMNFSVDYQILFSFLILFASENIFSGKNISLWMLGLGAISGFCLLTKFSLGICIAGALFWLTLSKLYNSFAKQENVNNSVFCIFNLLLSAASVAFIFINPNRIINLKQILICLTIAVIIGSATLLIPKLLKSRKLPKILANFAIKIRLKIKRSLHWRSLSCYAFYAAYCICLLLIIYFNTPSLIDYLKTSLDISSGYSSAMSLVSSPWILGFAISELILILLLLTTIASETSVGFSLGLAFVLWITFKHGFVRQDPGGFSHTANFLVLTPFIVSLCIARAKKNRTQKVSFLIYNYVLVGAIAFSFLPSPFVNQIFQNFNPTSIINKSSALLNIQKTRNALEERNLVSLESVKLPPPVTRLLKDKKIDIVSSDILIVEANKLNWKPMPVFQSYSAYTTFLDQKNSQSILSAPRDYIIYQFSTIDGRHPFFDQPETFFNIYCNYKLSSDVPNLINTPSVVNLMILENHKSSTCSTGTVGKMSSMAWKQYQSVEVNDGFIVRAAVNIEYSTFGKIYKTLFRSPPVKMKVKYTDGSTGSYRIIPENSNNGVIISHLPANDNQALSFFQGHLDNPVTSFSFSTNNSVLYKPNINVVFTSYKVIGSVVKKQPVLVDVSHLKSLRFLSAPTDEYMGYFDSKQKSKDQPFNREEDVISTSGWATRKLHGGEKCWVLLTYDRNNTPLKITETGTSRPDVAKAFNNSKYMNSGWSINFSSEVMPEGVHDIKAWIYDPTNNSAIPLNGMYRVEIR